MTPEVAVANLWAHAVQATVVVLAVGTGIALARLRHPAVRLGLWQATLVLVLALPLLQPWRSLEPGLTAAALAVDVEAAEPGETSWPVARLGLAAYGIVVAAALVRLAARLRALSALRSAGRALDPAPFEPAFRATGARAELRMTDAVATPVSFGVRPAVVLLPPAFVALSEGARDAVLTHELLHVRRRDWLWLLLEESAGVAFAPHPAVRWLLGRIRLAREQVVDRAAVALHGDARGYLEALLAFARAAPGRPAPALAFLGRSELRARVELLMEDIDMSRSRSTVATALAFGLAAAGTAYAAGAVPFQSGSGAEGGGAAEKPAPPQLVHRVNPLYPPEAKAKGIEGDVVLQIRIEPAGEVSRVRVEKGDPQLGDAAVVAVRQWRYAPAARALEATITVRFTLDKKDEKKAGVKGADGTVTLEGTGFDNC